MRQIFQDMSSGRTEIADVPCPQVVPGHILIQTRASLISVGTERTYVEFSIANLMRKTRAQPDKIRQVLGNMRAAGRLPTLEAVFRKLREPLPLGHSNAGIVLEVGPGVNDIRSADRVVSSGHHAEFLCIPQSNVARIPDSVSDGDATFAVLASMALQGIRLAEPTLGEKIMVFGVGLLGLLTVQLLRANGCDVLAIDSGTPNLRLARQFGAKTLDLVEDSELATYVGGWTANQGADAAILAVSTKDAGMLRHAAENCRRRARIILAGEVGLNLPRSAFYEKELTFQVSCSYGPGRYDPGYEQQGHDYPYAFVRWTGRRNLDAALHAISVGSLNVTSLISQRHKFTNVLEAYKAAENDPCGLGVVLQYPRRRRRSKTIRVTQRSVAPSSRCVAAIIGASDPVARKILPHLGGTRCRVKYIAAETREVALSRVAADFDIEYVSTDYGQILEDRQINAVFVLTPHDTHARLVLAALRAGKHVFVESPLAVNEAELRSIEAEVQRHSNRILMVGFNRRFSEHTAKIKDALQTIGGPLCMNMTVSAGEARYRAQGLMIEEGGTLAEICHFMDLLSFVADSPIHSVSAALLGKQADTSAHTITMVLQFVKGSVGSVSYTTNGPRHPREETLQIFCNGAAFRLVNFHRTNGRGLTEFRRFKTVGRDLGYAAEIATFVQRITEGGKQPIPFDSLRNVTRASLAAMTAAAEQKTVLL